MSRDTGIPVPLDVTYSDDPTVVKRSAAEDYTNHVVPLTWRSSTRSLSMAWYSLLSGMFYLVTAATLTATVGAVDALIGIVLACAIYGVLGFVFSKFAARTGLTAFLFSQRLFGTRGAVIASIILAATGIYYAVFEISVAAEAFHAYFGWFDLWLWYALVIVLNLPLVMGGVRKWMDKGNRVLLPVYVIGLLVAVLVANAGNRDAFGWIRQAPAGPGNLAAPGWLYVCFVYLGILVFVLFTMDFARMGRPQDVRVNGLVTFGPLFYVLTLLGNGLAGILIAYSGKFLGAASEATVLTTIVALLGGWGILFIWVNQARVNAGNLYVASINLVVCFRKLFRIRLSRIGATLLCGAVAYLMILTDVPSYLLLALAWQGVFVAGWIGIALVHIAMSRKSPGATLPEFRPGRLASVAASTWLWVAVSVLGILFNQYGGAIGRTWSTPATLLVAAGAYAVIYRRQSRTVVLRRQHDPRDEVADIWAARVKCHVCAESYAAVEMDRDPRSTELKAICASCAGLSREFHRACVAEHESRQRDPAAGKRVTT
ncbi:Purine-cytosine permease [Amycolatopsis rubida]|uniref:Purine-cytosine permease n=1 Tax=Amycolatopsis rubida TaxID=112413 RepID=A0A1I5ZFW3_9PSEU|nr:Purine-cytosine permease [Amycolatopsis rubida]